MKDLTACLLIYKLVHLLGINADILIARLNE